MRPLTDRQALGLTDISPEAELFERACEVRDREWGRRVTFSPKVFLPLTNLCRNRCDYCSFRRSPGEPGAWTMTPDEVTAWLDRGRASGAVEALVCLGDQPESSFSDYRTTLARYGHARTVDYIAWTSERALERGLLPHTNAGVLSTDDMRRLRPLNVSLGLMLENVSPRLCEKGMPHHRAPDKRPERRISMIEEAGRLRIPLTTGLLIGIGETRRERVESLLEIRRLHRQYDHIQEVIIQNFTPRPGVGLAHASEAPDQEMLHAVAMARLILDPEVSLQAPPNLNPRRIRALLRAGINDWGGISPVTPDYINPRHAWPELRALSEACETEGFTLAPRLAVYDRYVDRPGWLDAGMVMPVRRGTERLGALERRV